MWHRFRTLRRPALAFSSLAVVLLAAGAAAFAATVRSSEPTIKLCVARNGTVSIVKHCDTRTHRFYRVNQRGIQGETGPAGPASPIVAGNVNDDGSIGGAQGSTIRQTGTGVYLVTVTACPQGQAQLTASPAGQANDNTGVPFVDASPNGGNSFQINAGNISGNSVTPSNQGFSFLGEC